MKNYKFFLMDRIKEEKQAICRHIEMGDKELEQSARECLKELEGKLLDLEIYKKP